ncbi:MAG: M28 family peptidase [Bacillota bacterium]
MTLYNRDYSKLEEEITREITSERLMKHINWFVDHTPDRLCSSPGCWQAMDYIVRTMRADGVQTEVQEFFGYNSTPLEGKLTVLEPERWEVPCVAVGYAETTPAPGIEGYLLDVGAGGVADYQNRDIRGFITMAQLSYSPAGPEKARLAVKNGAAGQVLISWGRPGDTAISRRAIKGIWGNPTPADMPEIPELPMVTVSRPDGEKLLAMVRRGPVKVQLFSRASREWMDIRQPIGEVRGGGEADDYVLVSGHLDSWVPGATDNADGNALQLELARALAARRGSLRRSVRMAYWTGHEIMEATGSSWYCDTHWDSLRDHAVAYLNVDSNGLAGADHLWCLDTREFWPFTRDTLDAVMPGVPRRIEDVGRYADQSFRGLGLPAMLAWSGFSDEYVKETQGAILGWWNHTDCDTRDKIDVTWMDRLTRVYAAYVVQLACQPVLPLDYRLVAERLGKALAPLVASGSASLIDLGAVQREADECLAALGRLERARAKLAQETSGAGAPPVDRPLPVEVKRVNEALKKLGRILSPVAYTVKGKYAQDPYGLSDATADIPPFGGVRAFVKADPRSEEGRLLWAQALRERNAVSDALRTAAQVADAAVEA